MEDFESREILLYELLFHLVSFLTIQQVFAGV